MANPEDINLGNPLMSDAQAAALGALAARTVGALVKIGANGLPADASMTDAQAALIVAAPTLRQTACPAFSAGAATVAPGTLKVSEVLVSEDRTMAQNSVLTLSATDAVSGELVAVTCRALTLGYTLTVKNGGPAADNMDVIPAAMTASRSYTYYFDGTNWLAQGFDYVTAR